MSELKMITNICVRCERDLIYHHHRNLKCPVGETVYKEADETALPGTFNAEVWARIFVSMVKEKPQIATDEATMLGWFANALMRGYDEHYWRSRKYRRMMRRILVVWWKRPFVAFGEWMRTSTESGGTGAI